MSDSPILRRQPPSPLVFSPETVLTTNTQSSTSGSGTVSMPFVRRHVTRRLKAAKAECDKELQRVTNNITAFFEERLREGDQDQDRDRGRDRGRPRDSDSQPGDSESLGGAFSYFPPEFGSALPSDNEYGSDGGYDVEAEYTHHNRQPSSTSQMSPASLRRQNTNPWDKPLSSSLSSSFLGSSPASSTVVLPEAPITRKATNASSIALNSWGGGGVSSHRLSRNIHMASKSSPSAQSSRSTSRSRSPLPPLSSHASYTDHSPAAINRRSSRILTEDPVDSIMAALYDLIGVATDIGDMTVAQLTAQPKVCESLVQRVQNIGKAWEDHPDWHGRNWYVQILLAVASLSRVVEWWEAEKQFWNFDENDPEDEPLLFVTKSAGDDLETDKHDAELENFRLNDDEQAKHRLTHSPSQITGAKEGQPKVLPPVAAPSTPPVHQHANELLDNEVPGNAESARVLATERLRLQAETAQKHNIVMELSLDGEHFLWVNHAWRVVVGTEPDELSGTRISSLLSSADVGVFKEATQRLQEDDSHTVEVRFQLQVVPTTERESSLGRLYQYMEGKGMLMIDRIDGQPSHTMWVVRPISTPHYEHESVAIVIEPDDLAPEPASSLQAAFDRTSLEPPSTPLPFSQPISADPILCRICECKIPQWYFEKHSETCAETHRLEAEIIECNESIGELRSTIRDIVNALDRASPNNNAEYRGMSIYRPPPTPNLVSSPLQLFRATRMQKFGVKKMQKRLLEQLDDILQVATEVSMPTLKEEEANEPVERQRLLSPGSERKITQIRTWPKPTVEDAALTQLVQDAERIMRQKVDNVVRMQNTIRYAEKIWLEWQDKVEGYLGTVEEGESDGEDEIGLDEQDQELSEFGVMAAERSEQEVVDDHSSTASVYAYAGESSSDPTPMASSSAIRTASPDPLVPTLRTASWFQKVSSATSSLALSAPGNTSSEVRSIPMPAPATPIPSSAIPRQVQHTRSSTPSSISSPLALAAPIVASPSLEDSLPPMSLDDPSPSQITPGPTINNAPQPSSSPLTIKTHRSTSNLLEPKLYVTPPASPRANAREANGPTREPSIKRSSRRHSTANLLTSPNVGPLSPRQSTAPITRTTPTSIKDFDVIKPISKGAFGSVFLAKKKATGDYFAIKVLKKADMIAKNQITNVKAERMILMKQAESPFVAKLYFTFQSKDNLYLVMEYLNGGDCAALIKSLGCLPEEWTKNYIAEVVLGLEYLHQRGIIHRDLKPDNLLIDQQGHLKLTDFGLSRIGLLGRQNNQMGLGRPYTRYSSRSRPPSIDSSYLASPLIYAHDTSAAPTGNSYFNHRASSTSRSPYLSMADDVSESSGSDSMSALQARRNRVNDSPLQSFATELTTDLRSYSNSGGGTTPPGEQKFVGTPDYLAPETILGLGVDDAAVDWWALGVITYEFLYGIPPFHAETPEKVFENILSGRVEWHEDWIEFSEETRDFIKCLLTLDPSERLGSNGPEEVKAHPFFAGIKWNQVTTTEAAFIPQVTDPESTDYFDPRGAIPQLFQDDDPVAIATQSSQGSPVISSSMPPPSIPVPIAHKDSTSSSTSSDFGSFSFKNLPVLKQANDDMIRKFKTDQMAPLSHALSEPTHTRRKSLSTRIKLPPNVVTSVDSKTQLTNPPSPATSTSSIASSPSRISVPPPTPGSGTHTRKTSEFGALERFKQNHMDDRRNSMPSRLRTASVSSTGDGSGSETWNSIGYGSQQEANTPPSSVHSIDLRKGPDPSDRAVTCLLAEDNPITAKIIETLLIRLGCRCVVVHDGSEAISVAMGDIKFDCILMDLYMPVLDGEGAARYIKSTNSKNTNTPIIAVSAYSSTDPNELSNVFSVSLPKPVAKADLLAAMRKLGFKTSTMSSTRAKILTTNRPQGPSQPHVPS
ncbi:RIM15 response regulator receiver protein [Agaricus bisporus var. burnettii JB137-S8]|uniref:non-specific serine/threonine protein kinase n=1 Tax=Agaricus bisporus var. burnettii (strain JB137-S8 / ATCC MYA-4627 / FGSC 10392) TaxID=597362 RepID=K5W0S1_AGABU|nr:RIM15 response regulator receiver protein [Agaricus bisporus var. burnettii JB137-S8]EKM80394.1 RIM15 response regulator receiver protein [Agaricus bisporus var. burnettii JB137-S8]